MGLTLNTSNGQITLSSSTAGNYEVTRTVTNSNDPNNPSTATDIVTINPADNAAFSYSGSPYDIAGASNPTPTVAGLPGGIFSSISGFNFDGTDDITLPSITLSNDFSFSFWFYTTSATATMYFFGEGANWCRIDNGVFDVKFDGYQLSDSDPSNQPTFTIPTNQWNNVILVKDSNSLIQVYFNGQVDPNYTLKGVSAPGVNPPVNAPFSPGFIGRRSPNYFTGKLSSFALWNSDQSSNISNIYNNGVPQSSYTSTPYVWYKMSNDATYNSSTSTWSIPNAANPGTLDASSTTLPSNSLDYLDVNSSTGLISLSTSNVGTYSVSYNTTGATGSLCPATNTQSVQLVNTNFDFPSAVCNATGSPDIAPTNFISGQGGSFSMTPSSGLAINNNSSSANFGTISPAGSIPGIYAIKYEIGNDFTIKNVTSSSVLAPLQTTNTSTLSFNGTSSYIDAGSSSDFEFQASDSFTLSVWIYPTVSQANRQMILANRNWNTSPYQGWDLRTSLQGGVNRIEMSLISTTSSYAQYYATPDISLNQWSHVVAIYDASPSAIGDRFSFYINGSLAGKNAISAQIPSTITYATNLTVGAVQDQNGSEYAFWNGKIDEVAIWNRVLTSCDATGIYQASSNGITADLSNVYPSNLKYYNRMGD